MPARVHCEHRWGPNYQPGLGLPLDWFTNDQQWHIVAHGMRNLPTMTVLAERAQQCNMQMHEQSLEIARHLWECPMQAHEWRPARQRLHPWLNTYVGPRASQVQGQLWDLAILEQWTAAIATPSLRTAHLGLAGPHDIGTEFIRQVEMESHRVWLSHSQAREGLIKARAGPRGSMVWALWELQLHQQAERQGPRAALS